MHRVAILSSMIAVTCAGLSGCGSFWAGPSKTDPRAVYVWPTQVCPSVAAGQAGQPHALGTILLSTLTGNVVSGLIGIPADALKQAADADVQGFKAAGTNARFYYVAQTVKVSAEPQVQVSPPSCYVVAYTAPTKNAKPWCDTDSDFAKGVPNTCLNGFGRLRNLRVRETLENTVQPGIDTLAIPDLYVEIGFEKSGYDTVVRPKILAMYYPKSLLQPGSDRERMLTLQIDMTSAFPSDPFKAASVTLLIPNVRPSETIDRASMDNVVTGWATIPVVRGPAEIVTPADGSAGPYGPVTIKASVSEVGDPHRFLQAFAKAFGASASDYAKAINNEISPTGQATTQQANDKAAADFMSALAAAQKSRGDLLALCASAPTSAQGKATAESTWTTAIANQMKANNAADLAGQSRPYTNPMGVDSFSKCW